MLELILIAVVLLWMAGIAIHVMWEDFKDGVERIRNADREDLKSAGLYKEK